MHSSVCAIMKLSIVTNGDNMKCGLFTRNHIYIGDGGDGMRISEMKINYGPSIKNTLANNLAICHRVNRQLLQI